MKIRLLFLTALLCGLGVCAYKARAVQSVDARVYLGGVVFVPASIQSGTSTLKVSVATTSTVPSVGANGSGRIKALLAISENQNFGEVSYTVSSQTGSVELDGGGRANVGEFTFTVNPQNTGRGNLVYRVALTGLQNNPTFVQMMNPMSLDATLSVATPTPTPTPTPAPPPPPPPPPPSRCDDLGGEFVECGGGFTRSTETCRCTRTISPVLIDLNGDGFNLSDVAGGVLFDIDGDGLMKDEVAWTNAASDDAWLALDRNENGVVDNGLELFGDLTPQPYSPTPNGFVALGFYDRPMLGGNGDGRIDRRDEVFSSLRLWQDFDHDGVCVQGEMLTLASQNISSISLDYKTSKKVDRHGNEFRYRAKVEDAKKAKVGRWAWDVFLVVEH